MILPILIGLSVVVYMMVKQLDYEALTSLKWDGHTVFWIILALVMYVLRHLFLSWRLMSMADYAFNLKKSINLIVLWEFASAVSPTTIGGSGVALFFLAQEKISTAKTVSIVLYSMVLDTLFFVIGIPIAFLLLGANIIRPGMHSLTDMDGYGYTFLGILLFMLIYSGVFFYGLFINPNAIKNLLVWIARLPIFRRWNINIVQTARDIVVSANEMKSKPMSFHYKNLALTFGAWIARFFTVNCIIIALVSSVPMDLVSQAIMTVRGATMHVITSFSPTPGGAGIAEYLFGGFYSDYIMNNVSALIALIWRLITYYSYLIAGAIVIPVWIASVLKRRRGALS